MSKASDRLEGSRTVAGPAPTYRLGIAKDVFAILQAAASVVALVAAAWWFYLERMSTPVITGAIEVEHQKPRDSESIDDHLFHVRSEFVNSGRVPSSYSCFQIRLRLEGEDQRKAEIIKKEAQEDTITKNWSMDEVAQIPCPGAAQRTLLPGQHATFERVFKEAEVRNELPNLREDGSISFRARLLDKSKGEIAAASASIYLDEPVREKLAPLGKAPARLPPRK